MDKAQQQSEYSASKPVPGIFTSTMEIFRITDEKIAETWEIMDLLSMLQQLDVIPQMDEG